MFNEKGVPSDLWLKYTYPFFPSGSPFVSEFEQKLSQFRDYYGFITWCLQFSTMPLDVFINSQPLSIALTAILNPDKVLLNFLIFIRYIVT